MNFTLAALAFCALAAGALAEEFSIRPSVWGTKEWPGGYEIYNSRGAKIGEAKASNWGQDKWYGGYDVKLDDRLTTQRERRALAETLKKIR